MLSKPIGAFRGSIPVALLVVLTLGGCSDFTGTPSSRTPAPAKQVAALPPQAAAASPQAGAPAETAPLADRESWYIYYIQGTRVGYGRVTIAQTDRSGRRVVRVEGLSHVAVKRFGQQIAQEIHFTSIESPRGQAIEFDTEIRQGGTPVVQTTGKVIGDRLHLETITQGKKETASVPWSSDYGGLYAAEGSLLRRPMQPGERRTVRGLMPGFNQVAAIQLSAQQYEPVQLLGGTFDLLRIETTTQFPQGTALRGVTWMDRTGEILKNRTEAMQLEEVRATKALALEKTDVAEFDLGWGTTVKVNRRLPRPHDTRRVRYRVRLEGGDPAEVFVSGPSQQVEPVDPQTAEVTVYALRPGRPAGNPGTADDPAAADDRRPNSMIQSDNAKIVAMARQAAGGRRDPWQVVQELEQYVHQLIDEKDFSQAFATAAEVAENPVGDCSEHAVLLAALARALGIPARVAVGLVYMEGTQSLGYHMWTEVYVQRRWIGVDATLAKGGIGAAHLKLAHSNLHGASAYSSFLPVVQVAGRLDVEILEAE